MAWSVVKNDRHWDDGADDFYDQLKDSLEVSLIDDGTLDTVIDVNGKEYRFNYGYSMEGIDESLGDETPSYDKFVEECMEDAKEKYIQDYIEEQLGDSE